MNDKVKSVLNTILEQFKTGKIPKAIAIIQFPKVDVPMNKWSMLNKLLCFPTNSFDCRGFLQWKEVGRHIKKGAKAVHILVPWIRKSEDEDEETAPIGFLAKPVFPVEQTEGEPLAYQMIPLPEFPLMERAKELGITIKTVPGNDSWNGCFSPSSNEIKLATETESVFMHELIHAVENKLLEGLKKGQDPLQEIVAELGASTLCQIVGKDGSKYLGNSYQYIEHYAEKLKISTYTACFQVLGRVEKAINYILRKEQ